MSNVPQYYTPGTGDPDASSLNTLAIFYYIIGGLQALVSLIFVLYIVFGVLIGVAGVAGARNPGDAGAGVGVGAFVACFGIALLLLVGTFAFLNFMAGNGLRQRRRLTLVYVMAAIACLNFHLGTILGIFTFITLGKPGVKESFH
ncbi:MAG TPA: hypothetical protein VHM90_13090 [Phycisphaerae bacterium]|nr:hypothetical protein [Phycisphaerae bacterium]